MTMLKQTPSRNQRSKGFKIKHFLQVCLLLAICIWLLNQVKHSYEKKKVYGEGTGAINEVQHELESIKLGRKDLHPRVEETALEIERHEEIGVVEEEVEESTSEDNEEEGRGGGDDEIDGHNQEKAEEEESEEVEDLIDEEDKEKEEESDEQEYEVKGNQNEDQIQNEGRRNSREAREEHYKGDDASSAVVQHTQTKSTRFQIGGLRKVKGEGVENAENNESEKENENFGTKEDIVEVSDSGLKVENGVITKHGAFESAVHSEEKSNEFNLANSDVGTYSNSSTKADANENSEENDNSRSMLRGTFSSPNGTNILSKSVHNANVTATGRDTFLQAVFVEQNRSSKRTIENEQSHFNITLSTTNDLDAAGRGWMVLNTSESAVPELMKDFNPTDVTQRSFAFTTVNENSGKENEEESSASLATSDDLDAVWDESFDSSDSLLYQEYIEDEAVLKTLPGIEIEANYSEVAVE